MQKHITIVALTATIVIAASSVAQAQWYSSSGFRDDANYTYIGATQGDQYLRHMNQTVGDLYHQGGTFSNTQGSLAITNLWVTTNTFGFTGSRTTQGTASTPTIGTLYLQVGQRDVEGTQFGTTSTSAVINLSATGLTLNASNYNNGQWGAPGAFAVRNDGTVSRITMSGGTFDNYGTVNNMAFSGGTYAGTGTVTSLALSGGNFGGNATNLTLNGGTYSGSSVSGLTWGASGTYNASHAGSLSFANNSGVFTITAFDDGGVIGFNAPFSVGAVDLTNANLALNMSSLLDETYTDAHSWTKAFIAYGGGFTWESLFGAEVGASWENIASLSIDFGGEETIRYDSTTGQWEHAGVFANLWTITSSGVSVTPEPATLAVLGLGLVGLGLARRRMKK